MTVEIGGNIDIQHSRVLSNFLAETQLVDIPNEVVERAKLTIADTLGVAISGSVESEMQQLYERLPKEGDVTILKSGFPKTNDISKAALANATAICFVELDEGTPPSGHPALHVLPPALAMSQYLGKSGSEFLEAFILGYEAHYRVQKATELREEVYPHGNTGHIGAVVAIGKLLGWDAEQFRHGINIAAGLPLGTSYDPCLKGSTIASVFASIAGPIAFIVKDLVESGFTGYDSALSDTFGKILGENFNSEVLTDRLGIDFGIMNNHFKFHASCGVIHPSLEAIADALNFRLQHEEFPPYKSEVLLNPNDIKSIKIKGSNKRPQRLMYIAENKKLSAKFSLPFTVATYLIAGNANIESFNDEALANTKVRMLEKLVSLEIDSDISSRNLLAEVSIELKNGELLTGKCEKIYGRIGNSSKDIDVYNKFMSLTNGIINNKTSKVIWDRVINLETESDMRELFKL
ncbi:MmgE/PrpD family protein [Ureibacillus manganicus]|uniref:MmgE/PrpD family protein n=1 Tax=Ureibacillus manganicus TaxID=1266064 RepID=UPI00068E0BFC|nr:MmgE/PrpD family protein [Ureibacillus manganicus]